MANFAYLSGVLALGFWLGGLKPLQKLSESTASVVAGVDHPAIAPAGLLMAVRGYVAGIYGGLARAWKLAQLAN